MCEVTTMMIAATAVAAAGSVVSGVQQYQQQRYQAKVADANARQANAASRDALERGRREEILNGRRTAEMRGAQTAAMAASGLDVSFGSPLDVVGDTALLGAEDAQTIRDNSMREVRGFQIEASNYHSQAKASRMAASGAAISSVFDTGSTILGGAAQVGRYRAGRSVTGW